MLGFPHPPALSWRLAVDINSSTVGGHVRVYVQVPQLAQAVRGCIGRSASWSCPKGCSPTCDMARNAQVPVTAQSHGRLGQAIPVTLRVLTRALAPPYKVLLSTWRLGGAMQAIGRLATNRWHYQTIAAWKKKTIPCMGMLCAYVYGSTVAIYPK